MLKILDKKVIHLQHLPTVLTEYNIFSVKCTRDRLVAGLRLDPRVNAPPDQPNIDALVSAKRCQLSGHSLSETI